ncbi:unnamed protein product [Acanthoscelides obtectus]|uniref:Uncharacterized protein n=1 Tax=Acanthoscelides obtectus TaxID=200917 RepID=A0A9P0L7H0_ACAOB|nr:unnamed protein product [Acanthoscelides obtectus]CAK1654592.1 hypothetical protein AOBTE_LOCUS18698 [Acanthoscelides obtectus]
MSRSACLRASRALMYFLPKTLDLRRCGGGVCLGRDNRGCCRVFLEYVRAPADCRLPICRWFSRIGLLVRTRSQVNSLVGEECTD